MKLALLLRLVLISTSFFASSKCISQLLPADSSLYQASFNNAIAVYHHALSPETNLYNGEEYITYDYTLKVGHPYFQSTRFSTGYIVYNNILYQNVPLLYDLVYEKIIINDPAKNYRIQLNSERVSRFSVLNHIFIRIVEDSSRSDIINTGFYDLLYDGKTSLLKKQGKKIVEVVTNLVERFIQETNRFYIKKDGKYFSVNKKKSLLKVLGNKKTEINQYIRNNKLNIRKNKDDSFVKILAYYDEITK